LIATQNNAMGGYSEKGGLDEDNGNEQDQHQL
jgi:hypothetical protein